MYTELSLLLRVIPIIEGGVRSNSLGADETVGFQCTDSKHGTFSLYCMHIAFCSSPPTLCLPTRGLMP
jgi:hypothetical protein